MILIIRSRAVQPTRPLPNPPELVLPPPNPMSSAGPNSLTRPHAGWLPVLCFKTHDTWPEPKQSSSPAKYYEFWTKSDEILRDPVTFWCSLAPIRPSLVFLRLNPVFLSSDPAILGLPSLRFAQIRRYWVWFDLDLHKSDYSWLDWALIYSNPAIIR